MPIRSPGRARLATAFILALAACDRSPNDARPPAPSRVEVAAGNGQEGVAGAGLDADLVVRVVDERGRPVAGQRVAFRVTSGGGSVVSAAVRTDAGGEARARWTLGTSTAAADTQRVEARVDSASVPPAVFAARARPGAAAAIAAVGAALRAGVVGSALAEPLAVRVTDGYGNPVPGAAVSWTVRCGGSVAPAAAAADTAGVARARWTLGVRADSTHTVVAAAGPGVSVTHLARAEAGPPARIEPASPAVNRGVRTTGPAQVRVFDEHGNPAPSHSVRWTVVEGGGVMHSATTLTDAAGWASTDWTYGPAVGPQRVAATVDGTPGPSATLAGTASGRLVALALNTPPPTVRAGSWFHAGVRAVDAAGTPIAGLPLEWRVTSGGGTVQPSTPPGTGTDGNALAGWVFGGALGTQTMEVASPGLDGSPHRLSTNVIPGWADALLFRTQPSGTRVGVAISPRVQLYFVDPFGNPTDHSTAGADLFLSDAAGVRIGGGSARPIARAVAVDGVIAFDDVTVPTAGTYTLTVSTFIPARPGETRVVSAPFTVAP